MSITTHRGENRRIGWNGYGVGEGGAEKWWESAAGKRWWGRRSNETGKTKREREEAWGRWLLRYGRHHHPSHPIVNSGAAVPNLSPCVLVRTVFYRCLLLQAGSNTDISALPALCDALASVSRSPSRSSLVPFLLLRLSPAILSLRPLSPQVCGFFCLGAWENVYAYANEKNRWKRRRRRRRRWWQKKNSVSLSARIAPKDITGARCLPTFVFRRSFRLSLFVRERKRERAS